jgi:CheY-like chemotaxis protein
VIGDQARLRQVIVNLVGNAVKFTEKGEVVLKVEMEAGSYQPRFHFSISDTGIGIPEDRLEKIFDSFTQADGSTTRRYGGTGLGTTISMQLVELMGGSIWAESPTNKQDIGGPGSTFHFTLELPTKTDPERSAPLAADLAGKRVLVVDDNLTNRRLICALLENWEMRADCAESGARALKIVHEAKCEGWQYDLFLVDVAMPEMDGVELIRRLSDSNKDIARSCVIISSTHQLSEKGELEKIGCRAYLQKPIRNSRLFDLISKILGSSRQVEHGSSGPTDSESQSGSETGLEKKSYKDVWVLLAEDNKINQHLARRLLEKKEFKVDTVEDGRQAVEAVLENEYDLVLMDVQMPVMKGSEATRLIRENEREKGGHLPIIALTANAMKGDREHCLEAGMDDHLTKPINPVELYKCIEKYIKIEKKGKKQSIT